MFKQKTKKNIAVALAFIFAASNLWAAFPQKAFGVPVLIVGDTSPTGILNAANLGVIAGATSATAVNTTITTSKESWLDSLGWMMANVVIDQFGDAIVDWIRNGFEGSPMFLSDPEGFFRETANQASGAIISKFNAEWLCSPLGKLKIDLNFLFPGTDRVKYGCTFNDITGNFRDIAGRTDLDDWVDFNVSVAENDIVKNFSSDYRNGGFLMWLTTADWKNNDVGATLRVVDDAFIAASAKISLGAFQLDLGQGFFGVKKCLAYDAQKNCVKEITTSPGQLVQDQLKLVAGKDLSRLEVADEINEIIGALATTMMGWLLTGGNEGEGVMGYDINAYYSGTSRDHFGTLSRSQQINQTKFDLAAQIQDIENNEKQFSNYLENYAGDLYGAKEKLEIVLAKLKCIKATSTKIVYDDTDCDNMDESIKKITVSGDKHGTSTIDKTLDDITSDITKTEDQINSVNGKISIFFGQYGEKATSTSVQALKLFDEFESGVMFATMGRTLQVVDDAFIAASAKISMGSFQLELGQGFFGMKKCLEYREAYDLEGKKIKGDCVKEITTSPGQLVQDQLKQVGGKDLSRLEVADEINEIIGALATTMMGWLLTGGNDGGGVLGYDKNADYSGSNRDHYGELSKSQQIISKKSNISSQIQNIKSNEERYSNSLENYADALYGAKEKLEIVLTKLKCIKATSTWVISDDTDCDGMDESIKKITVSGDKYETSAIDKTINDITSDISKTEDQISSVDGKISTFTGKYGDNATSTSVQALELFDEFESEVNKAGSLGKITSITNEYCYSYNKDNKTGEICGLFGDKSSSDSMAVHVSSEINPVIQDSAGNIKTKIYWKALNAESCQATGGDSDKIWKKTEISTSGSYTTTNFATTTPYESRTYGVKCADAENNNETAEVSVSADSSVAAEMSGSLFAKNTFVKSGESSSLYWLSSNASQCYLYSDQDSFSGDAEYITSSSDGWFAGSEGYYLKTSLTKTTGQSTATFNAGETFQYKLICGDSNGAYKVLSGLEIASEDGSKETYKTHGQKKNKVLIKETAKIEAEMERIGLEFACLLNEYTQVEGVSESECGG